nr:MAG: DNA polymerase family B [Bacteriophage sp.]
MIDFLMISTRSTKRGVIEIYPKFIIKKSSDLMIRGGDFYAIWLEDRGLWSTDEQDALQLIDRELDRYAEENRKNFDSSVKVLHMWDSESGMIDSWHKYCQKQMRDSFHMLDEKLIFSNTPTNKKDYASKKLKYPLEEGTINAYDKLMSTLYSETEREKIEWAIGSIVCGDSKKLQKFMVLYGAAGTGKSTVLNIIQQLFDGYYSVFDAKALGSSSNSFALEAFKSNPLVAIQHDGDLSRIEDNTRLNSLVSHELMTVNEKFKSTYANRFKCFLFMGTNKPVKITDAKSGLIRRLIDVSPSGDKLSPKEYKTVMKQIEFELGAIAYHCQNVYLANPGMYDDYIPVAMLGASNDFYNFIIDSYHVFKKEDGTTLKASWEMYKTYCDEAKVPFPFSQRIFKEELKNYFRDYKERFNLDDGTRVRSYYIGFRTEKFEEQTISEKEEPEQKLIEFKAQPSVFDKECADCPAQYATSSEIPTSKWEKVKTKLSSIDTSKLHYVKVPENHIVIDFDIPDKDGNKSFELNLKEASKWPPTYAELSKSGQGIHLHYIYAEDPAKLSRIYDDHIEVKVFNGKSSLRRKLTKCNNLPIATINSGLPLKGEKQVINFEGVKSEKGLRTQIKRNLNKEYHPATKPSIDFIYKILEDAYASDLHYDVTDMRNAVLAFAASSTHQADYCIKLVNKMQFKSADQSSGTKNDDAKLVFYDVEVFPNLFLVNWKIEGEGKPVVRMINPTSAEIEELMRFRLVGFNCRRYDNHILYARLMGYTNEQLFSLSNRIINGSANCFFGEAYNVSYTDVYDFCSKKQSLKKWEIELGIHHQELGLPWDQPVPEEMWTKVAEYCDNDVMATEAVFNARKADFTARQILADVAGMTVNDTTNSLTTKIIFGNNRKPQDQFNYRFMGEVTPDCEPWTITEDMVLYDHLGDENFTLFNKDGKPVFPGYTFEGGKSIYRGEEVGEGGYVYAEPGMYSNIALLDIASMHPSSIVAEELFGPEYTKRFNEILQARIAIKHKEFDKAKKMLNGALAKYLTDEAAAADLAQALKIAINSVYGLTSASFDHPFRDNRNKDNIVAKRGALFMVNLKHEVQRRGFTVAHIKTDSIKIPDATPEIIQFVMDYGKQYGYNFEHEATYDRMCLVNDAVYIAKYKDGKHAGEWTATGTQFQVPYVFKKLFSKEPIEFEDMCETKSVTSALYLDMNEGLPDVSELEKELERIVKRAKEFGVTMDLSGNSGDAELDPLVKEIAKGHNYHFIGKVGQFCPIKPGCGGGILLRETENKKTGEKGYAAATGSKGFRWLESEMVRELGKENDIDRTYYNNLVDEAVKSLSSYGDFERFVADEPFVSDNTPPWFGAGEPHEEEPTPFDVR